MRSHSSTRVLSRLAKEVAPEAVADLAGIVLLASAIARSRHLNQSPSMSPQDRNTQI